MTNKELIELQTYAELEGSELGEAIIYLCMVKSFSDMYNKKFNESLDKELRLQLKNFRKNTKIVKRKVETVEEIEELEWII